MLILGASNCCHNQKASGDLIGVHLLSRNILMGGQSLKKDSHSFHLFLKMGHSRPLFLYFRLFNAVNSKQINVQDKSLPMTGFEPETSDFGSDRSTNWATTTAQSFVPSFYHNTIWHSTGADNLSNILLFFDEKCTTTPFLYFSSSILQLVDSVTSKKSPNVNKIAQKWFH